MDRGYPSTPAFIHMMDKGIKFIVRLKSSDYKKEQSSLSENDQLGQSDIRNPLSLLAHDLFRNEKKPTNLLSRFIDLSFVSSSERGIRTLDTTGMNRVL